MRKDIKNRILAKKDCSEQYRNRILAEPELAFETFQELFLHYMCAKFLLEPSEITTDDFYEICQISAEKAAKMPHGALDAAEAASKCGGATTAMNKKVLFVMAIKREYGILISPEESAAVDTFTELCRCVYTKLQSL